MTTKSKYVNGVVTYYDDQTYERTLVAAPVQFGDDFLGAGHTATLPTSAAAGYPWIQKTVLTAGSPVVGAVANGAGGQMSLFIGATSEKMEATLYQADQLTWDATKTLVFQARVRLSVLPSVAAVQAVFGLSSAWIDGPDNASFYIEFGATGNGKILLRSKDGVNTNSVASGVTVLATEWHQYRFEVDPNDTTLHFFIDGVEYTTSASPIKFAATGANAVMQLYHSVYKASGTGVGTMLIDNVEAWSAR